MRETENIWAVATPLSFPFGVGVGGDSQLPSKMTNSDLSRNRGDMFSLRQNNKSADRTF